MEDPVVQPGEDPKVKPQVPQKQVPADSSEIEKKGAKAAKSSGAASKVSAPTSSVRKKVEPKASLDSSSSSKKLTLTGSSPSSNSAPRVRRNSTGGLAEKATVASAAKQNNADAVSGKKSAEPVRRSLHELRSSLPSVATKPSNRTSASETRKSTPATPLDRSLRRSIDSDVTNHTSASRSSAKPSLSVSSASSASSSRRVPSTSVDSTGSSTIWKTVSKLSSPSSRSPTFTSGLRSASLSSSLDRGSNLSGRRKAAATPEIRDSKFIVLPQVEIKAGDDVRLDLRGHRVRSLTASGLNLSSNLEVNLSCTLVTVN
ncbi:hypothetical protein L484_022647 [Morus notabilis]|uniref:Uncharacterized protein n=1 Tax=Morus notabilis TaxID=981085 RepID=W9QXV2_9ROSA|nr:187-kDa microtubule-associated protein AIR9 isoform X1 [Morus notabilis]XP_024020420.1 187-kDa microtubule-associated protein AIR9 isoform X1 [Morus notabilis]EXB57541.1 hypothetical protein L484_022647 [Morus notabilis]